MIGEDIVWLCGPVQVAQGSREGRETFARDPRLVLPFRQIRQAAEGFVDRPPYVAKREPFCERVYRFDEWQRCKAGLVYHAVRVNDLQHAIVEFGRTRYVT